MKANIHPTYYSDAKVTCACGNSFNVGSARQDIRVELCAKCHPFFTGEEKFVDTLGRVERFKKRTQEAKTKKSAQKIKKITEEDEETPKTLYEMAKKIKQEFKEQDKQENQQS